MVLAMSGGVFLIYRKSRLGLFLLSIIVIPLICLLTLSAIRGASAVYLFHTLPAYYMAAAIIPNEIINALDSKRKVLGIAMVLALLALQTGRVFEHFTSQYGDRPRWEEATEYTKAVVKPGDLIASTAAPVVDYYLGSKSLELKSPERVVWVGNNNLGNIRNTGHSTWLLSTIDILDRGRVSFRLKRWLQSRCKIMRIFEAWTSVKNRSVLVYRCSS